MSNALTRLAHADRLLTRLLLLPYREGVCPSFVCVEPETAAAASTEYEKLRRDILAYLNSGPST